jgi:hypothetical protein
MPTAVYASPAVFGVISLLLGFVVLFSSRERNWLRVMDSAPWWLLCRCSGRPAWACPAPRRSGTRKAVRDGRELRGG